MTKLYVKIFLNIKTCIKRKFLQKIIKKMLKNVYISPHLFRMVGEVMIHERGRKETVFSKVEY